MPSSACNAPSTPYILTLSHTTLFRSVSYCQQYQQKYSGASTYCDGDSTGVSPGARIRRIDFENIEYGGICQAGPAHINRVQPGLPNQKECRESRGRTPGYCGVCYSVGGSQSGSAEPGEKRGCHSFEWCT